MSSNLNLISLRSVESLAARVTDCLSAPCATSVLRHQGSLGAASLTGHDGALPDVKRFKSELRNNSELRKQKSGANTRDEVSYESELHLRISGSASGWSRSFRAVQLLHLTFCPHRQP